jgi:hypothetical protein
LTVANGTAQDARQGMQGFRGYPGAMSSAPSTRPVRTRTVRNKSVSVSGFEHPVNVYRFYHFSTVQTFLYSFCSFSVQIYDFL